jgi:hypothetical protein
MNEVTAERTDMTASTQSRFPEREATPLVYHERMQLTHGTKTKVTTRCLRHLTHVS